MTHEEKYGHEKVPTGAYRQCAVCRRARNAAYYAAKRDKARERYASNREKVLAYTAEYRAANPEKVRACKAAWREANPEAVRAGQHARRAREFAAPGRHTADDVKAQLARQKHRCYWCNRSVRRGGYHVDHVIPLARGGSNGPENIVIACARCNASKGAKLPHEWALRIA